MCVWPESLIREIADRRVIIFIGAGISKLANTGFPTWADLLGDLCNKLPDGKTAAGSKKVAKSFIKQGKLLDAAQIVTDSLNKADLDDVLTKRFRPTPTPKHEIYRSILELDSKIIVTTNYDEFIEKNFEHYSGGNKAYDVNTFESGNILDKIRSPRRFIVKMHGCIHVNPSNLVLDRTSFFRLKEKYSSFFAILHALFMTHTVLFLGYSVSDPDLQLILEDVNATLRSSRSHYALLPTLEHSSVVNAIKNTYNIECIQFPKNQFQKVSNYLEELKKSVEIDRAKRGITT